MRLLIITFIIIPILIACPLFGQEIEYVSSTLYHGFYSSVVKIGDYAYCGGSYGLQILSVANPANPMFIKRCEYPSISIFHIEGNFAYASGDGLRILDLSDTLNPVQIGYYESQYYPETDISISGDYAYITTYFEGADIAKIEIIDISDPTNPTLIDTTSHFVGYPRIAIQGNHAYVTYYSMPSPWGLKVYDISDPINPIPVNNITTRCYPFDIKISGNYAYIADFGGLSIYDISEPSNPVARGAIDIVGDNYKVYIHGNIAYLLGYQGIHIIDVIDPDQPELITTFEDENHVRDLFCSSYLVYYVNTYHGDNPQPSACCIVAIIDPSNPDLIGRYDAPCKIRDVSLSSNYALVANDCSGLQVIDISDPQNPILGDNFCTPDVARNIFIYGNYAYLTNYNHGIRIFDISNPSEPFEVGFYDTLDITTYVYVDGDYAYVINREPGYHYFYILILDISDPSSPIPVNTYTDFDIPYYITVVDNIAYISCVYSMEIVDMTDPVSPIHLGSHFYQNRGRHLCVKDNYAYIACSENCLEIVDITNPENPSLVGTYDSLSASYITVDCDYAYLSSHNGLYLMDISCLSEPTLIATYENVCCENKVCIQDEYIYVPAKEYLLILRLTSTGFEEVATIYPSELNLFRNYPNPFNTSTTIRYDLPEPSDVTINIYDILGRKVETAFSQRQQAGLHSLIWQAEDYTSGIYFYKLTTADFSQTKKMILLK